MKLSKRDPFVTFFKNRYNPYKEAKFMGIDMDGNYIELQMPPLIWSRQLKTVDISSVNIRL